MVLMRERESPPQHLFTFTRDDARRRVLAVITGPMNIDTWSAIVTRQIDERAWQYGSIFDMRAASSFEFLDTIPEMIARVATLSRHHGMRGAVVLVVPPALLTEFQQRLFEYADRVPYPFEAYTDMATAETWLDGATSRTGD